MRIPNSFFHTIVAATVIFFLACKKNDNNATPPLPAMADSLLKIVSAEKVDDFKVTLRMQAQPPKHEKLNEVWLQWNSDANFGTGTDSMMISAGTAGVIDEKRDIQLKKIATNYNFRLKTTYKNQRYYSGILQWKTDPLKITVVFGNNVYPVYGVREFDQNSIIMTNLPQAMQSPITTRVYIGSTDCPVLGDESKIIRFHIPASIPPGRYKLRLQHSGTFAETPDSVILLKNLWQTQNSPVLPLQPGYSENAILNFGSCYSDQKGFVVGGFFLRTPPAPQSNKLGFILQFDPAAQQWKRLEPTVPRYLGQPVCYYYNNSIYVISAVDYESNGTDNVLKKMLKFDLNTQAWSELGTLPHPTQYAMPSFEYKGEWFIGLGGDLSTKSLCCGDPLPSKKFRKYNPTMNVWTPLADFPGDHSYVQNNATAFVIGDDAYFFFGAIPIAQGQHPPTKQEFWKYNIPSNSWSQINLPTSGLAPMAGADRYQIVTYNGKAYFLSAYRSQVQLSGYGFELNVQYLEYDPVKNTFERVANGNNAGGLQLIYRSGNKFYFQSNAGDDFSMGNNQTRMMIVE